MNAPQWFRHAIGRGLQQFVCLSLQNQPPAETIALTKEAWVETLWAAQTWVERDTARLHEAFVILSRRLERWPAPRVVLDYLPPAKPMRALPKPRTEAMRTTGLDALKHIQHKLRG